MSHTDAVRHGCGESATRYDSVMTNGGLFHIKPVKSAVDLETAVRLFTAYASSLEIDLAFQNFREEIEAMPGKYAPPAGALLLAHDFAGNPAGCVGLRPIAPAGCCEMKRLYVSPTGRGLGIGKALIDAIVLEATRIGYLEMRLDTLPSMAGAISLYKQAGFNLIKPYYETPVVGTIFLGRPLVSVAVK